MFGMGLIEGSEPFWLPGLDPSGWIPVFLIVILTSEIFAPGRKDLGWLIFSLDSKNRVLSDKPSPGESSRNSNG